MKRWHLYLDNGEPEPTPEGLAPWWSEVVGRDAYNAPGAPFRVNVRIEVAAGWPLPSMRYCYAVDAGGGHYPEPSWGLISLSDHASPPSWDLARFRALPLLPVWRGLAGDTGIYGAMFAALLWGIAGARRIIRRRRGRCVCCGYSLAGLPPGVPCPECSQSSGDSP